MNLDVAGMSAEFTPPINNACLPNMFDKLDADARERVRVMNSMLNYRLKVQEKIIDKYKSESLKFHTKERGKIQDDLKRIIKKSPSVSDLSTLNYIVPHRNGLTTKMLPHIQYKGYATETKDMKGLQTEKENKPFCDRFYTHHIPTFRHDKFMTHAQSLKSIPETHESSPASRLLLSRKISARDNFLPSKGRSKRHQKGEDGCLSAGDSFNRTLLLTKELTSIEDDAMTV